jgi:predicted DsbA family dithiol-disulfide isomerase
VDWKAFELRPYPAPLLQPDDDYLTGIWQQYVYPLAVKMGFTMKQPPVQPRTRLAHAAAKWAAGQGRFATFNRALFKGFFQDGRDIGKLEIIKDLAEKSGLDPHGLESGEQLDNYVMEVMHDEEMARMSDVRAVPAYVSKGKVLAAGVQSVSQLQRLFSKP